MLQEKTFNDPIELLKKLISIPSVTGTEAEVGTFLAEYLSQLKFEVQKIPVDGERFNVLATIGKPRILLQAHIDVVPPHIEATENNKYVYGRGACDTKGSIACMIVAAQNALKNGVTDFGVLFTIDEEVGFAGAKAAKKLVEKTGAFLIVGEPTKLKPVSAHYGISVFQIVCTGVSAHSSEPQLGKNAIDMLVTILNGPVKDIPIFPGTLLSVVKISGGTADNIIPDSAQAMVSLRIAPGDTTDYAKVAQELIGNLGEVKGVQSLPPVKSFVPKSLSFFGKGQQVKYCTELTFLKNGFVFGPGDIADAHKPTEKVLKSDLKKAVAAYEKALIVYKK